jgi:hypothetical protein
VGGYPAPGFAQGARWIGIDRRHQALEVKVVDVPCDWRGDIAAYVRESIAETKPLPIERRPRQTRVSFPGPIESAVENQLYERTFYKTDVKFDITVEESGGRLRFLTKMSYGVVNRMGEPAEWWTEYNYDVATGRILKATFNDTVIDPSLPDARGGRGLSFPYQLGPREAGRAYVEVEELFDFEGSNLFTSYYPATDLEFLVRWAVDGLQFDANALYFWKRTIPVNRTTGQIRVQFKDGLLPYQGLRLRWTRRRP